MIELYGKVFDSIYDGTLAGHWQAIVTMQQLVVLATPDGIVDMTPDAISRRTSIPIEIITAGLEHLAKPDPYSRTPGDDGKRIVLLDDHRPWGWRLVNHWKYMRLRNMEQKREADRVRIAGKRKKNKDVAIVSRHVADVAHSDSDLDVKNTGRFDQFWTAYPKKVARKDAIKAFEKLHLANGDFEKVLLALEAAKKTEQWKRDGGKYIPHAATWLNGRRFEDEGTTVSSEKRMVI